VFVRGLVAVGALEVLERGRLSDHAPVAINLDYAS
jgi:endonuclease/exonuclease/phosphatase family metal-dependent hydrolase